MDHASSHLSSPSPTSQFLFSTHNERQLPPYKTSPSSASSSTKSPPTSPLLELPTQHDHHDNDNNGNLSSHSKRCSLTPLLSPTPDGELGCFGAGEGSSSDAQQNRQIQCNEDDHLFANTETNCNSNNHDNDEHNQSLVTKVNSDYNNNNLNDLEQQHHHHDSPDARNDTLISTNNETTTSSLMNEHVKGVHHCPIDQGSLADVDDEDDDDDAGMHTMLSGSSSSSASTLPLLTESHSHHSFSRISLGEYSPLSLVEDCDNALPISPTSLACSAHSSFKTSLNGLKMDNLDVGVGHVDHDGVHDVDVNDTRSLSPSILSSNNNHHNLWSNSSTAITQNTSLLNGTSTSFLMSHHHHQHQLSTLLQHLEPQSMDEPLISGASHNNQNINGSSADGYMMAPSAGVTVAATTLSASMHRPSSEPPPGVELSDVRCSQTKPKQSLSNASCNAQKSTINSNNASSTVVGRSKANEERDSGTSGIVSRPTRRNRSRSNPANQKVLPNSKISNDGTTKLSNNDDFSFNDSCYDTPHDSRLHLQLNHHKKLKELQQRLFGDVDGTTNQQKSVTDGATSSDSNATVISYSVQQTYDKDTDEASRSSKATTASTITTRQRSISRASSSAQQESSGVKQEPDSQSNNNIGNKRGLTSQNSEEARTNDNANAKPANRTRSTKNRRRGPAAKSDASKNSTAEQPSYPSVNHSNASEKESNTTNKTQQKTVKTEKAEPDTTTKSSDYIKLADLLSNNSDQRGNSIGLVVNDANLDGGTNDTNGCTSKRVQQIQLQVSPSLTVVANGGLMQSMGVAQQPQLQQQNQHAGTVITSSCGSTITNQILCRPHAVISSNNGQIKNLVSGNDLLSMGNTIVSGGSININGAPTTMIPNWSLHTNSGQNISGTGSSGNAQTIGAHQIAIQVICQDGTSLVLPVSSAAGLNAAVSLTSQHPQLQAVLSNSSISGSSASMPVNTMQQQLNCNQNQLIQGMSVSNIVNQQQQQQMQVENVQLINGLNNNSASNATVTTSGGNSQTTQTASSGLAASSPTLAALLDAGSNRSIVNSTDLASCGLSGQNLLRKLVTGGNNNVNMNNNDTSAELNVVNQTSTAMNGGSSMNVRAQATHRVPSNLKISSGEKRIKLESSEFTSNTLQANFTLVDPQTIIVNDESTADKSTSVRQLTDSGGTRNENGDSTIATSTPNNHPQQQQGAVKESSAKQAKNSQGSSTGNRQVDPTQPFRCEHCNSTFTRLGNFTRHKKIHTVPTKDGQRFKCDVCSKSFLQRCDLARHLHIHRGTEPHRCNICGKGYIRHSDLVTHQRFHNKEKPFGCPHCSKGFCQRGDLNRHLRSIHLQMKPILCPCCNRKFAKQETLLRHLNTAHRNKPGTANNSTNSTTSDQPSNCTLDNHRSDDRQALISVVTGQSAINNVQKNSSPPVSSLQAIRATLCQVQQPVDASSSSAIRNNPTTELMTTAKAVS